MTYDFGRDQITAHWDCGLSYLVITPCIGWDHTTACRIWNRWVQVYHTELGAGSQLPNITNSWTDRRYIRMYLMDCQVMSRALSQEMGPFCSSRLSWSCFQLCLSMYIHRSGFNGVFSDEPGSKNAIIWFFQTSLYSVYSLMMVGSKFCGIVKNLCPYLAFNHLVWWHGVPLDTRLSHLLFYWRHFEQFSLHFCRVKTCGITFYLSSVKRYALSSNAQPGVARIVRIFLDAENIRLLT